MTMTLTGKWCYSIDEESYSGKFDTEAQAHAAAQSQIDEEAYGIGDGEQRGYWIARCAHPLDVIRQDIGDDVVELLIENMEDEIGGDDVPIKLSREHETELGKLIIDFVRQHASVQHYGVQDDTKHSYIIGSNA